MIGDFDSGDAAGAVDADIGWITGIRAKFRGNQFSGRFPAVYRKASWLSLKTQSSSV